MSGVVSPGGSQGSGRNTALNFLVAGIILVVGILCYLFLLGRIEQIEAPYAVQEAEPEPGAVAGSPAEPSKTRKAS